MVQTELQQHDSSFSAEPPSSVPEFSFNHDLTDPIQVLFFQLNREQRGAAFWVRRAFGEDFKKAGLVLSAKDILSVFSREESSLGQIRSVVGEGYIDDFNPWKAVTNRPTWQHGRNVLTRARTPEEKTEFNNWQLDLKATIARRLGLHYLLRKSQLLGVPFEELLSQNNPLNHPLMSLACAEINHAKVLGQTESLRQFFNTPTPIVELTEESLSYLIGNVASLRSEVETLEKQRSKNEAPVPGYNLHQVQTLFLDLKILSVSPNDELSNLAEKFRYGVELLLTEEIPFYRRKQTYLSQIGFGGFTDSRLRLTGAIGAGVFLAILGGGIALLGGRANPVEGAQQLHRVYFPLVICQQATPASGPSLTGGVEINPCTTDLSEPIELPPEPGFRKQPQTLVFASREGWTYNIFGVSLGENGHLQGQPVSLGHEGVEPKVVQVMPSIDSDQGGKPLPDSLMLLTQGNEIFVVDMTSGQTRRILPIEEGDGSFFEPSLLVLDNEGGQQLVLSAVRSGDNGTSVVIAVLNKRGDGWHVENLQDIPGSEALLNRTTCLTTDQHPPTDIDNARVVFVQKPEEGNPRIIMTDSGGEDRREVPLPNWFSPLVATCFPDDPGFVLSVGKETSYPFSTILALLDVHQPANSRRIPLTENIVKENGEPLLKEYAPYIPVADSSGRLSDISPNGSFVIAASRFRSGLLGFVPVSGNGIEGVIAVVDLRGDGGIIALVGRNHSIDPSIGKVPLDVLTGTSK